MRTAMRMLSGSAELVQTACPSSMPSASVSLPSLLRRRGSACARRTRSALQSLQLSPPSVERITPETSSTAKISPRRRGCGANLITRQENGILAWIGNCGSGMRFQLAPRSSVAYGSCVQMNHYGRDADEQIASSVDHKPAPAGGSLIQG